MKLTPMQQQYYELKKQYPDTVLMFRLGDFYEVFHEDAVLLSKTLGLTLTGRGKSEDRIPMAGIPYHALPNYLPKIVKAQIRVAIAEQMEEATAGQLVKRQVTKIITSGTIMDEKSLDSSKNNYIAAIYISDEGQKSKDQRAQFCLSFCDLTTGEFKVFKTNNALVARNELVKISPSEILCSESQLENIKNIYANNLHALPNSNFEPSSNRQVLIDQLHVKNLKGFGLENNDGLIVSAGNIISYLKETQKTDLKHISKIKNYHFSDYMQLDEATIRNLELLFPINTDGIQDATLFATLNKCLTAMGKRKLRYFILNPLVNPEYIKERLDAVEFFFINPICVDDSCEKLSTIFDLERICGRIGLAVASPKDLVALKLSLENCLDLCSQLSGQNLSSRLKHLVNFDDEAIGGVKNLIESNLQEDPPFNTNEGNIFKDGINSGIDELRNIKNNSREILLDIQKREIERTGINTLKISFNQVFGYYIEISRAQAEKAPVDYIRKQTLANAERFITEELKELEEKILGAEEKLYKLEQQMFLELRSQLASDITAVLDLAEKISEIDIFVSFANVARENRYCKPEISRAVRSKSVGRTEDEGRTTMDDKSKKSSSCHAELVEAGGAEGGGVMERGVVEGRGVESRLVESMAVGSRSVGSKAVQSRSVGQRAMDDDPALEIGNSRHPIVEQLTKQFVPNDVNFSKDSKIHILTGPNMSGKSTFIRQVALITLMAQIGSFVPADSMEWSVVDRIFTRVGASDNLARGESTFMVEMSETANILNNATNRSLIILDEVGRGTSTYDGVAIAWSIIEYIQKELGSFTLFATHYHELIALEDLYSNIKNFNVQVSEEGENIKFEHKIIEGGTNRSYGVHVAKLAGVPQQIINRAGEILERFEGGSKKLEHSKSVQSTSVGQTKDDKELSAFSSRKAASRKKFETGNKMKVTGGPTQNSKHIIHNPLRPKPIHPEQIGLI